MDSWPDPLELLFTTLPSAATIVLVVVVLWVVRVFLDRRQRVAPGHASATS